MESKKKGAERSPKKVRKDLHKQVDKMSDNFALFILTFIERLLAS